MVRIKICGITNLDDASAAVEAGADLLGFVFYRRSPRYVEPAHAAAIINALQHRGSLVAYVGVFVNETLERIRAVMQAAPLDLVQLHGNEPPDLVSALKPFGYKALRPRNAQEAHANIETYRTAITLRDHAPRPIAPRLIVDSFDAKQYGGTGTRADWQIAAELARTWPILLAGGLDAENVADAIHTVNPWGVDVSSGVERALGLKDQMKVRQFIAAAKSADLTMSNAMRNIATPKPRCCHL